MFRVNVREVIKSTELTNSLYISIGNEKKTLGNFYFSHQNYQKALRIYTAAADMIIEMKLHESNNKSSLRVMATKLIVDCLNNVSFSQIKLGRYKNAKDTCGDVIQNWDKDNMKALCRAAHASILEGAFEEAGAAINAALSVNSEDKDAVRMYQLYRKRKHQYTEHERKLYSKMASAFVDKNSEDDQTENQMNSSVLLKDDCPSAKSGAECAVSSESSIYNILMAGMFMIIASFGYFCYRRHTLQLSNEEL